MADIQKVINAWKIFRNSNPYEICDGREFRAISEPEYCMGQMIADTIELLKEYKAIIEEEQDDDYDPCYECRGLGDDYIVNDEGELESWCDKCGVNPDRMKDDE